MWLNTFSRSIVHQVYDKIVATVTAMPPRLFDESVERMRDKFFFQLPSD